MTFGFLVFVIVTIILMSLSFPIVTSMLGGSVVYFLISGIRLDIMVRQMFNGVDSFVLLAIPFFILSAQIMNGTNVTNRLFSFAEKCVGHIPGGLCHVNVITSIIFAGMSGSSIADTSGIGYMATQAMIDHKYDKPFSAALTISSAVIGPIIPPSIPMVMYAVLSGASVGKLFLGGVIPGLLMGLSLSIYCYIVAGKYHFPLLSKTNFRDVLVALRKAFLPLMTPVVLLGGIYSGAFTPTEAAAVCTLYALIIGVFINKETKLRDFVNIGKSVINYTGVTVFVIMAMNVWRWIIVREQIPVMIADLVSQMDISKAAMLLILNIILLVLGCFLPLNTTMLAFVPIILPLLPMLGIDLVHFGVVLIVNLMIGLITPPFGMQLFVINGLTGIPISDIVKKLWPMFICLVITLLLITYVEPLVTWLPGLFN